MNESGFDRYNHDYCLFHPDGSYSHKYNDYSKKLHPDDDEAKYDVMVCPKCVIQKKGKIETPEYLNKMQPKIWLILHIKKIKGIL
ncbi:MAG: hypothetical protein K8F52_06805 [Candidatus Scalindua rubra]|nr:hypothetical protein [Candidatus Scalindua rubra]